MPSPQLSPEETDRFYRIWIALLNYINERRRAYPPFSRRSAGKDRSPVEDVDTLRDALWADDVPREQFIAENPAQLPPEDLEIVRRWTDRMSGKFFIFRYLKKFTIFLSTTDPVRAYGVLGLVSEIEEIIGPYLPVYVEAVLLPFDDRIIYDSVLLPYNVSFGSGIQRELAQSYRDIQEREGVITALPWQPDPEKAREWVMASNKRVLAAFRRDLMQAGLMPATAEVHFATIEDFAQSVLAQQLAAAAADRAYLRRYREVSAVAAGGR